jgi:hypothetical protein
VSERPRVILALTPPTERAIEELLFGQEAPLAPAASVAEADELERMLDAGHTAVLLSPELAGLTPGHCARARAAGLRLVGIALDERDQQLLSMLGADAVVPAGCTAADLHAAIVGVSVDRPSPAQVSEATRQEARGDGGALVAVVGSKGAPGASECAVSLAALAAARWPALLVELDTLGGSLALRLGADAGQGSLVAVARALASERPALGELLERWLCRCEGWPAALPLGEPDPDTLTALAQPGATSSALRALTAVSPLVVVDVGFLLGDGGELGARERVHREALVSADAVVLVLGAREAQLEAGLAQLDLLLGELGLRRERLRIILNGLGGPGTIARRNLEQALLERLAARQLTADSWLPWDGRALRRAEQHGLPLALARPRGGYTRALLRFLDELFLPTAPATQERKRKLPRPHAPIANEEVQLPWQS